MVEGVLDSIAVLANGVHETRHAATPAVCLPSFLIHIRAFYPFPPEFSIIFFFCYYTIKVSIDTFKTLTR